MSLFIIIFFVSAFSLRIFSLFISIKNEKSLKQSGAVEYGKANSLALAILHILFYLASFAEGLMNQTSWDSVTTLGFIIYVIAISFLFIVIYQLSHNWTVKLIISTENTINKSFLFKYFRHPNYFLNIIPELIGLTFILKSYTVFIWLFPVYSVSLFIRIYQEEKLMQATFPDY